MGVRGGWGGEAIFSGLRKPAITHAFGGFALGRSAADLRRFA
jgi:hypothetical protein